jgi:hypothetical protein
LQFSQALDLNVFVFIVPTYCFSPDWFDRQVTFYASGYDTMDEFVHGTTIWASGLRQSFEDWIGFEDRASNTHPEVLATKHMSEDEVLNYVYDNYVKEPEENATSEVDDGNSEQH